jgi:hypothetical protein
MFNKQRGSFWSHKFIKSLPEVDVLLHKCGVYFGRRTRHDEGISDARRLEFQELSSRDD